MKLILSPVRFALKPEDTLLFTAGPILGGGNWQVHAIELISESAPHAYIACPGMHDMNASCSRFCLPESRPEDLLRAGIGVFTNRVQWERYYMRVASEKGCLMFWLPEESRIKPRPPDSGSYARDTLGELGEWRARAELQGVRVVIGAHPKFPGFSTLQANLREQFGSAFPIHPTLETTVATAVRLANHRE